jgi:hypothetical protein
LVQKRGRGGEGRDFNEGEGRGGEEKLLIIYLFGSIEKLLIRSQMNFK